MPLLSLIEDNLNFVRDLNIEACDLSTKGNIGQIYQEIRDMKYKLIYLTPEKLVNSPGFISVLEYLYKESKLDRFVIDEVHCVSHWGQDFRKDYLSLNILKQNYPTVPLLCLTATATIQVKEDIAKRLGITDHVVYFQSSFNRTNLIYEVRDKKRK